MRKLLTILPILSLFLYFSFSQKPRIDKNPYQILFDYINFGTLKGNVLINESTRTFGCGTAAMEYSEKLRKSGLDKFYDKYGYIYADKAQIEKVTAKNGINLFGLVLNLREVKYFLKIKN